MHINISSLTINLVIYLSRPTNRTYDNKKTSYAAFQFPNSYESYPKFEHAYSISEDDS